CPPEGGFIVRLACVRHAASVHPEPGSNSPFKRRESLPAEVRSWFRPSPAPRLEGARSGRVSVRKNRLLGFSLLRCSVSGFQGSAAPLPGPRRFRFHPKRKEIYYASVAPPSRTFFEILGLFSRRLPAPGGRGAPPPPSPSPAEKAARACYPLPAPGARGHFGFFSDKGFVPSGRRSRDRMVLRLGRTLAYISIGSE
ncbi:hypothetical protein HMPREF9458_02561, partial [Eggerthella lenta 1_1_60AFAA]